MKYDPAFLRNPFPWYAKMRREQPVTYDVARQAWMVFRYNDVQRVLSEWQTFSSKIPHPSEQKDFTQSMNYTDPPKHQTLRSLVQKAFTPRRVEELAPRIIQLARELVNQVKNQGHMDLIHDFSHPLPVIVIAEMLGVPVSDRETFKQWSDGIILSEPNAISAMAEYFRALIKLRRQTPDNDLISELIAIQEEGEKLTAQELVDFCILLLVGGNETTTNLINNSVISFTENPEVFEQLRREPELLPLAIEEALRYYPAVLNMSRYTKIETKIGEQIIPPGQLVLAWIGSANRDEEIFEHPNRFLLNRRPNKHLAFGSGIHFCLGAALTRLEAKLGLSVLLETVPKLWINPGAKLEPIPTDDIYGVKTLPIQFST